MPLDRDRLRTRLLLAGTIVFATLGQIYFFARRQYVWDAIIFDAIAILCFIRLLRGERRRQDDSRIWSAWTWPRWRRLLPTVLALLLNLSAATLANAQPETGDYGLSVFLWIASLVTAGVAFAQPSPARIKSQARAWLAHPSWPSVSLSAEHLLVLGLLLTGLVLRLWGLGHIPANLSGDEGTQGMWAVRALQGQLKNPFSTGWFTVPTMSFFAQAASLRLFGDSVAGLRTLSALLGTATLALTYLWARRCLGKRAALLGMAALTFNHYHIHFSRLGSNQIADPFFMALTLWLLVEGMRRPAGQSTRWFLAAGLVMGLSWYGYFGSRVIVVVVAAHLGIGALTQRDALYRRPRPLAMMALMAFMAASPLLLHYARHPENLTARANQVSFFLWLENELARPDHASTLSLVWRQIWRSISAFNYTLDPTFWYRAQIPLLDFVSGIFFPLGVIVALRRWRRPAVRLLLLWFGLSITLGWILTENPPSSMRMVIVAPAVALLVALGLDAFLQLARRVLGGRRDQWRTVSISLLSAIAVLNVHYYFIVYTPTRVYGNPNAESATVLGRYLADRDDEPLVYLYGPPFMYYDFGTLQFIARDVRGVNVPPQAEDPDYQPELQGGGPTLFVVLRERLDELEALSAKYPSGSLTEFNSPADGRLMFIVYEVP